MAAFGQRGNHARHPRIDGSRTQRSREGTTRKDRLHQAPGANGDHRGKHPLGRLAEACREALSLALGVHGGLMPSTVRSSSLLLPASRDREGQAMADAPSECLSDPVPPCPRRPRGFREILALLGAVVAVQGARMRLTIPRDRGMHRNAAYRSRGWDRKSGLLSVPGPRRWKRKSRTRSALREAGVALASPRKAAVCRTGASEGRDTSCERSPGSRCRFAGRLEHAVHVGGADGRDTR